MPEGHEKILWGEESYNGECANEKKKDIVEAPCRENQRARSSFKVNDVYRSTKNKNLDILKNKFSVITVTCQIKKGNKN